VSANDVHTLRGTYEKTIRIRTMYRNSQLFRRYGAVFTAWNVIVIDVIRSVEKTQLQCMNTLEMFSNIKNGGEVVGG
jgi:hypothetical protein